MSLPYGCHAAILQIQADNIPLCDVNHQCSVM